MFRRILFVLTVPLAAAITFATPALAVSAHFNFATVTNVGTNSITVSFKESGLGNSLDSVTIQLSGTAECINGGSNHPKATNKSSESASGVFSVSNGQAHGSLTMTATDISPNCSPPMVIAWTDLKVTDAQFSDSISIPGTFFPSG